MTCSVLVTEEATCSKKISTHAWQGLPRAYKQKCVRETCQLFFKKEKKEACLLDPPTIAGVRVTEIMWSREHVGTHCRTVDDYDLPSCMVSCFLKED
jgi:hypothetical protein